VVASRCFSRGLILHEHDLDALDEPRPLIRIADRCSPVRTTRAHCRCRRLSDSLRAPERRQVERRRGFSGLQVGPRVLSDGQAVFSSSDVARDTSGNAAGFRIEATERSTSSNGQCR
jgi:hypothetical protein